MIIAIDTLPKSIPSFTHVGSNNILCSFKQEFRLFLVVTANVHIQGIFGGTSIITILTIVLNRNMLGLNMMSHMVLVPGLIVTFIALPETVFISGHVAVNAGVNI